jgi:K+-transporting ATPase ATPase A chain
MHKFIELLLLLIILIGLIPLLGNYLAAVFSNQKLSVDPVFGHLERLCYKAADIDPTEEMSWVIYGKNLLLFNLFGFIAVFFLQEAQSLLPLNPQQFSSVSWDSAFNTAVSFVTNTNWQSYAGETSLSYLTQMLGLAVQNFLSAATGMVVLIALIRGLTSKSQLTIGNFWSDLVRTITYVLLPFSIILALILVSQGVIQNYSPYVPVSTVEVGSQVLPMGPAASQVAIKQLGTNGGGFFNTNSAHPFENPSGLSNFLQTLAILLIPAASVYMYGNMIGSKKQAWIILFVMFLLWGIGLGVSNLTERQYDPVVGSFPRMEGLETRFGISRSLTWSTATTTTSNGSVNGMLSSLSPLAGGIALFNIMLGEIIFGGIGVGLCGMLMFIMLTVFLSGLMVGRTPEYLGKKIEKQEILWVVCATLAPAALILIGAGISSVLPVALVGLTNEGPHGLTEILYAFSSAAGNNGSAFAGLNANTPYYNITLGIVMLLGRVAILLPSLAIAGLLAKKKITPPSLGTLSTCSATFAILLLGVIFIVGALTFFPALTLGPIVEHLLMLQNRAF